jgi:hypothetical protein
MPLPFTPSPAYFALQQALQSRAPATPIPGFGGLSAGSLGPAPLTPQAQLMAQINTLLNRPRPPPPALPALGLWGPVLPGGGAAPFGAGLYPPHYGMQTNPMGKGGGPLTPGLQTNWGAPHLLR